MTFRLTPKQEQAQSAIVAGGRHFMLFGGSRSGKTFKLIRILVLRALKAPDSRHCILRFRFNHVKASVILDTFPKVMKLCFPEIPYHLDKSDWYVRLPNKSEIWFGGLDDKERTEKILGQEYATIYLNECSQISAEARDMAETRLAQKVDQIIDGEAIPLKSRMFYDCNPPNKAHWTYLKFIKKIDLDTKLPAKNAHDWGYFQINPQDNEENLSSEYVESLRNMGARMRKRFYSGEFADATPNALFQEEWLEKWRVTDGDLPDMVRLVVAVDPSGADDVDNADNDEIGIAVAGIGTDGNGYLLEDLTVKAGPATWGKVACDAYDRHAGDAIVGETNFGGAMVRYVIQTVRPQTNFREVTASRGKVQRAEPFSSLYEQGKIRHVGYFSDLEAEMAAFSTAGYTGPKSPNRADAAFWAFAELFPAIVGGPKKKVKTTSAVLASGDYME